MGGSKGVKPTGKFSITKKDARLFRKAVQMWLATLRNLPYFFIADMAFSVGSARRARGKYVVLRFAREKDP